MSQKKPNIDELKSKIGFGIKFWLEFSAEANILGSGWAKLLEHIGNNESGSLTQAAKECNYSYKYAWNILKRIEARTSAPVVETGKGGSGGGGWVKLNNWGKYLLKVYNDLQTDIDKIKEKLENSLKRNE